jgi:beta-phosphoglucomutase-like phosphatase (HAD superfamily)
MKESVIFDMDGVLFDSERIYNEAWRRVGQKLCLFDIETCIAHCVGRNGRDIEAYLFEKYGPAFPAEQFRADIRHAFAEIISAEGCR